MGSSDLRPDDDEQKKKNDNENCKAQPRTQN